MDDDIRIMQKTFQPAMNAEIMKQQTFFWSFFFTGPWQRGVGRELY
tara:strand:- start:5369 stop:5506 length:138 start_codon:yes stop_codon:yes gene_type:complete